MNYYFVLGRNPELSLLEIESLLETNSVEKELLYWNKKVAVYSLPKNFNAKKTTKALGGTVKIAMELTSAGTMQQTTRALEAIDLEEEVGKKFYYSVSNCSEKEEDIAPLLDYLKERFKKQKLKAMLKWPKSIGDEQKRHISPKALSKRMLKGIVLDFVLLKANGKIFFGKTTASSNPMDFAERDSKRPCQKPIIATSIRLARILSNLSLAPKNSAILDPFCGVGTVLQENLLLGRNVVGIDLDQNNCGFAEKNLAWAKGRFNASGSVKIYCNNCAKLSGFVKESIAAVVSEPFMGQFLRKKPAKGEALKTCRELEALYSALFKELSKTLSKNSITVFLLPTIPFEGGSAAVSERVFSENGFQQYNILSKKAPKALPYLYKDSENILERRVFVLKKTK